MWIPLKLEILRNMGEEYLHFMIMKEDEFIEEAAVIVIPKKEWKKMKYSVLMNYIFWWGEDKAIALG